MRRARGFRAAFPGSGSAEALAVRGSCFAPARVVERRGLPGVDPRLVKAVGVSADQHFILLDVDALFAPIIGG